MLIFILSNLILNLIILYVKVAVFLSFFKSCWMLSIFDEFVSIIKILSSCINCYPSIVASNSSTMLTTKLFPSHFWLVIPYFASDITTLIPLPRTLELSHYQDRSI